jgi:hypothetical protein
MMTRITTTNQKKNTTIPGIAYPATDLALATASSYPAPPELSFAAGHNIITAAVADGSWLKAQAVPQGHHERHYLSPL